MYYTEAIGLGLVISLLFFEEVGLTAGGMVVPGYIALNLQEPWRLAGTLVVAFVTFGLIKFLSRFTFIYGRRRVVLTILAAFVLGSLCREFGTFRLFAVPVELQVVGFIIPGLIANTMERQGAIVSVSALFIAAIMVRLVLVVLSGGEVIAA